MPQASAYYRDVAHRYKQKLARTQSLRLAVRYAYKAAAFAEVCEISYKDSLILDPDSSMFDIDSYIFVTCQCSSIFQLASCPMLYYSPGRTICLQGSRIRRGPASCLNLALHALCIASYVLVLTYVDSLIFDIDSLIFAIDSLIYDL